jgi:hypothetical protein
LIVAYFCHLDTGSRIEATNLQLYSLQMAAESWNDLAQSRGWYEHNGGMTERLCFIVNCLGLSLSQLLGQNTPQADKEEVAPPNVLLDGLLKRAGVERIERGRLVRRFADLLEHYDAVRHFGRSKYDEQHRTVSTLTFEKLVEFRKLTIEIWDLVLAMYRRDPESDLCEINSIEWVAGFHDARPNYDSEGD